MLKEVNIRIDGYCSECGDLLYKGERCYVDSDYNEVYCLSCVAEELGNDRDTF